MDSDIIKILFYVVLGIIYLISQVRKGRSKTQASTKRSAEPVLTDSKNKEYQSFGNKKAVNKPVETPKPAPISLEDLLREFVPEVEKTTPEPRQMLEKVSPKEKVINYDEDLASEDDLASKKIAQDREAALLLKKPRIALADEHFTAYSTDKPYVNPYANKLKNSQDLKEAFVMSEILNRKFD